MEDREQRGWWNSVAWKQGLLSENEEGLGSDIDLVVKFRAPMGLVATFAASSPLALFATISVSVSRGYTLASVTVWPFA